MATYKLNFECVQFRPTTSMHTFAYPNLPTTYLTLTFNIPTLYLPYKDATLSQRWDPTIPQPPTCAELSPAIKLTVPLTHTEANDWCADNDRTTPLPTTKSNKKLPTELPNDLPTIPHTYKQITTNEADKWCTDTCRSPPLSLPFQPPNINTYKPSKKPSKKPTAQDTFKPAHYTDIKELISKTIHHETAIPEEIPVKATIGKFGLMHPRKQALDHEAAAMLLDWAENGCPVDTGPDWSIEQIQVALERGPHLSALSPAAIKFLHDEATEKETNKYAKIVRYGDIKNNLPKNFKVSPVSMVPHKSKLFRTILDLTFQLRKKLTNKEKYESVNSATTKLAPQQSMGQLGSVVKRIVATMADHFDPSKPFAFTKLDIKDGFWRMAVSNDDAWNFCYALPSDVPQELDDILLVVPNSLQMGWTESPPCFCSGTETARDLMEIILPTVEELDVHPLEYKMRPLQNELSTTKNKESDDDMSMSDGDDDNIKPPTPTPTKTLFECFVDDFMAITNDLCEENLTNISRTMLYAIHAIFPPPDVTGHEGEDSVSIKKIDNGDGRWNYIKEILGWIINGRDYTITLPPERLEKILLQINQAKRQKKVALNEMQQLAGKLQHASFAMPGGWGLFSPIQRALQGDPKFIPMTDDLKECLSDWKTILKHLSEHPTHVLQLVDGYPDYLGYTDSCKKGAGGVWMGITSDIGYIVWRVEFPLDIQQNLCTSNNPNGTITMNDLELAGLVLGWLVLEHIVKDLRFKHIGMNCDNTSAVSWVNKYRTAKSIAGARLLRLLSLRMHKRKVSPLLVISIAGDDNDMADKSSRSFGSTGNAFESNESLTNFFNKNYPLKQNDSWTEFVIPSELLSRVMSCVRGERSKMGQLLRLKTVDKNIGNIGHNMYDVGTAAPFWTMRPNSNLTSSSKHTLQGSGQVSTVKEIQLKFKRLLRRSRPSPRPSNWLDNPLPSTAKTRNTRSALKK